MKYLLFAVAPLAAVLFVSYPAWADDALGFNDAVQLAAQAAPGVLAQTAATQSAREAQKSVGRLPDPRIAFGLDNLPLDGSNQFSLDADFMTMQRIGVIQDVPNRARRKAQKQVADATAEREEAVLSMTVIERESAAAQAWLATHFAEQRLVVLAKIESDNALLQEALRTRVATGLASAADAMAVKQEALALADRRDELTAQAQATRAQLRALIGDDANRMLAVDAPTITLDTDQLHATVADHAEIAPWNAARSVAEGELAEAESARRGDWSWQVAYQKRGQAFGDMVSAEVSMDLPLWRATRQGPAIAARRLALTRIDAERDEALRRHHAEVNGDLASLAAIDSQRARLISQAMPLAEQRVALARSAYQSASGDIARLFEARRDLLMLRMHDLDLEEQSLTIKARLSYLVEEKKS